MHSAIELAPSIKRPLRRTDLTHRFQNRRALPFQNFNSPNLRYTLIGLFSFSSRRGLSNLRDNLSRSVDHFQGAIPLKLALEAVQQAVNDLQTKPSPEKMALSVSELNHLEIAYIVNDASANFDRARHIGIIDAMFKAQPAVHGKNEA